MNRSTDSVRSLTQGQAKLMTKNKLSHEKAFKFKHFCTYLHNLSEK